MTRRAKERRMERVQEKQRATEEQQRRDAKLNARPEWQALLQRIDGDEGSRNATENASPPKPKGLNLNEELQWKSTNVPIAASSVFPLHIKVDAASAVVHYEFSTRDFDINFAIQMIDINGTMLELLPSQRYESHKHTVTGQLNVTGPGLLLLVWDNSFSWLNTKQLAYTIELKQDVFSVGGNGGYGATPEQRAGLARHERLKREKLRGRHETELSALEGTIETQGNQIDLIKHQLNELQKQLERAEQKREETIKEREHVEDAIDALSWEIHALTWRAIDASITDRIFSFCGEHELLAWSLTNRRWHTRITSYREELKSKAENNSVETPTTD
ncbi:hypothetical protein Poli38472_004276 [Pythium oligandrum]|uniref:GOLD domain-containing protein n=1 Tax=Pythium oligandrum TaxID=41045 RepID=A0A8K1FKW8_PYTOL|nr:hypothetical protein Poli38472_004276 [Pythium oligandrum]|eukprot:TMW66511.1 hypothetical protein Poli38472_004276 [Pythium oligandrum]